MKINVEKDNFIATFLAFRHIDYGKIDGVIQQLETHIAKNEYDLQLDLLLHTFRTMKSAGGSDSFEEICKVAAPVHELLKTTDWGLVELHILSTVITFTPHYTISMDLLEEAFEILDDDDIDDHEEREKVKVRLYLDTSMRLMRARFIDGEEPQKIKVLFNKCVNPALSILERMPNEKFKALLLLRKAMFTGDGKKVPSLINNLETSGNKPYAFVLKEDLVAFFPYLGHGVSTHMINMVIGHQVQKKRLSLGMGTLDFADAIGTTQTAVNGIERGSRGVGGPLLFKIAQVLGVDLAYFYGAPERKYNPPTTDDVPYKMIKIMTQLNTEEKEYLLDVVKSFVKHKRKMMRMSKRIAQDDDGLADQ